MNEIKITKKSDDSLEIVSVSVNNEGEEYWLAGEVKNILAEKLDFAGVVVAMKDKDGQVINCAQEYVLGNNYLLAAEVGYFKHYITTPVDRIAEIAVSPFYQKQQ